MNRIRQFPRTAWAALLLAAAVAVPCSAWWTMGSRAAEREAEDVVARPTVEGANTAARWSERLRSRFETIVRAETPRPYYHYAYHYPDLTENCECAGWLESPLARGPADPLIRAHFAVDSELHVRLPTIPEETEGAATAAIAQDTKLLAALIPAAPALVRTVWKGLRPPRAQAAAAVAAPAAQVVTWGGADAVVEPFSWHTVEIAGRPELVAMRSVRASDGSVVQGMIIAREAVQEALAAEALPVAFRPREEPDDRTVVEPLGLPGVQWEVAVDAGDAVADARHRAKKARSRFRGLFWGGTGSAALAALLVVGLVGQAESLARRQSRFAASAAHELRTPLAGLRVYGEMLADGLGDPAAGRDYARQIATEADRLGRVVSNVLGYTRLERGAPLVRPEPSEPAGVVREAAERMRPALELNGARLELDVPEAFPAVPLDRDAVFQIVQNLVDNAERYSRGADDRTVRVSLRPAEGGGVVLAVADRGEGIAAKDRRRLFRPFARGAAADAPAGLGLGLALVAALVKGHGGAVRYAARDGGGALFTVTLPGSER